MQGCNAIIATLYNINKCVVSRKTMNVTSTEPVSKKVIDQYSEFTLTAVFKLKGYETKVLLLEMASASIALSSYNNMAI